MELMVETEGPLDRLPAIDREVDYHRSGAIMTLSTVFDAGKVTVACCLAAGDRCMTVIAFEACPFQMNGMGESLPAA